MLLGYCLPEKYPGRVTSVCFVERSVTYIQRWFVVQQPILLATISDHDLIGNVVFANFHAARVFAQRINDKRDLVNFPEQAVKAGQINAMGLIDEVSHLMVENYRRQVNPDIMHDALQALDTQFGADAVDR